MVLRSDYRSWARFGPAFTGVSLRRGRKSAFVQPQQGCEFQPQSWREAPTLGQRGGRFLARPTGWRQTARVRRERIGRNRVAVDDNFRTEPRVARASRPWAWGRNPVGILQRRAVGMESPSRA